MIMSKINLTSVMFVILFAHTCFVQNSLKEKIMEGFAEENNIYPFVINSVQFIQNCLHVLAVKFAKEASLVSR